MSVAHELLFAEMCLVCQTFLSFVISVIECENMSKMCEATQRERVCAGHKCDRGATGAGRCA